MKKYKHKHFKLYVPETGYVTGIKALYLEEGHRPTICGEHIVLANIVKDNVRDPQLREELLTKIDIVYDMGKRMGIKLVNYYRKYQRTGGWREGY